MSSSLADAFNQLLGIHFRTMTIERVGSSPIAAVSIKVSPSNFTRNLSGPEEIVIEGREFVISKGALDSVLYPVPKRGDRLKDPELGVNVITEVRELFGFGGGILGYRVRCG
jgi:hypothetical protein